MGFTGHGDEYPMHAYENEEQAQEEYENNSDVSRYVPLTVHGEKND